MRSITALKFMALDQSRSYVQRVRAIPGLIGYWPMGDTGSTFADSSGNNLTGTFKGTFLGKGLPWAGGAYAGYSAGFGDIYSAGFLSAFNVNEFTINYFVRPTQWAGSAANQYHLHFYADASNYIRVYHGTANQLLFNWTAGGIAENVPIGCSCWPTTDFLMITIAGNKSGNSCKLLINGEENSFKKDTMAGTWAGSISSNLCGFGGYRGSTFTLSLVGGLSNVTIYNRAITEAEARSLLIRPMPVLTGIGDSILQYTSRSSWVQGLALTRGWRVVNHGYTGTSIMGGGAHDMTAQVTEAAGDNASVIVLQHGINDANDAGITAAYGARIAALKVSNPAARIYGMGILPNSGATSAWRTTNNGRISTACSNQGIPYIDTDGLYDPATHTSDGVHPNDLGAAAIVGLLAANIS